LSAANTRGGGDALHRSRHLGRADSTWGPVYNKPLTFSNGSLVFAAAEAVLLDTLGSHPKD